MCLVFVSLFVLMLLTILKQDAPTYRYRSGVVLCSGDHT
jgi:hypothetical protein